MTIMFQKPMLLLIDAFLNIYGIGEMFSTNLWRDNQNKVIIIHENRKSLMSLHTVSKHMRDWPWVSDDLFLMAVT